MKRIIQLTLLTLIIGLTSCESDIKGEWIKGLDERAPSEVAYIENLKNSGTPHLDLFDYRPFYTHEHNEVRVNPDLPEPLSADDPGKVKVIYVPADAGELTVPYKGCAELYYVSTAKPPYLFAIDKDLIKGEYRNCFPQTAETVGERRERLFRTELTLGTRKIYGDPQFLVESHPA